MGTLLYFFRETFRGFYQAKLMTFISITIIGITLFFMGLIYLAFINIDAKLNATVERSTVNIFIEDSFSSDSSRLATISKSLDNLSDVLSYKYISKEDAIKKFSKLYGTEMLDAIDANPLPASFELVLTHNLDIDNLKQELNLIDGIETVQYSKAWLKKLTKFQDLFFVAVIVAAVILILILYFIISNTIRLTIYARRDLVVNMQYVGATDLFIKTPFILEGILQGIIGGTAAIMALTVLNTLFSSYVDLWGDWYFYPAILILGGISGWFGSASAVRKSLD